MLPRSQPKRILLTLGIILISSLLVQGAKPDLKDKDKTLSDQSDESKADVPPKYEVKTLIQSNSDKVEARTASPANNIAEIIRGRGSPDEKFKTAAQTPIGLGYSGHYGHGLGQFNSPYAGGAYAGVQPYGGPASPYAAYTGQLGNGGLLHPGRLDRVAADPHALGLSVGGGGYPIGHGGGGYGGVVYGGHGGGRGHEHVAINRHSEVGVGPFGEDHRRDTIQKSVNRVQTAGDYSVATPVNYYGDHGVTYGGYGNGLIGGGPNHFNRGLLNRQPTPFDGVVGPINPYIRGGAPIYHDPRLQGFGGPHVHGHGHGGPGYQQQGLSINKQSQVEVDPYGGVHRDVNIQKSAVATDGLGYNGVQNNVIAHHSDSAYVPGYNNAGHGHHGHAGVNPYFNNQFDPVYDGNIGHNARLLTTGPNRFYQGANPAGIYERYHRYG